VYGDAKAGWERMLSRKEVRNARRLAIWRAKVKILDELNRISSTEVYYG